MTEKINSFVSVLFFSGDSHFKGCPKMVFWNRRTFKVTKLGFRHSFKRGRTLYHVFSVVCGSLFMRLVLDTDTLLWKLDEISDGLPD